MTEVEISRLLQELSEVAETLNQESDSINDLIERFEDKLRNLNVGLEVWLAHALKSEPWVYTEERSMTETIGTNDLQLGFVKFAGKWQLATRTVTWRRGPGDRRELTEVETASTRLLDAPRDIRIAALRRFPELLREFIGAAKDAVRAIQDGKKLVATTEPVPNTERGPAMLSVVLDVYGGGKDLIPGWKLKIHAESALTTGGIEGLRRYYEACLAGPGGARVKRTLERHGRKTLESEYERFMSIYRSGSH